MGPSPGTLHASNRRVRIDANAGLTNEKVDDRSRLAKSGKCDEIVVVVKRDTKHPVAVSGEVPAGFAFDAAW